MPEWLPENSIVDHDLILLAKKGLVSKVTVSEHENGGFFVTMRIKPDDDNMFLVTKRVKNEPRIFMNLERLVAYLRAKIPTVTELKIVLLKTPENINIEPKIPHKANPKTDIKVAKITVKKEKKTK